MRVASIFRYPVKGLSAERLNRVSLEAGGFMPHDRIFAIENGPSGFDTARPAHQPKIKFLTLMRNAALARLDSRLDEASGELVLREGGREAARGNPWTEEGREAITAFLAGFLPEAEQRGPLKMLAAPDGFRFTDSRRGFVSLINLASVAALEERLGAPLDPLRFRGNLHVEGLKPWEEFDLIGRSFEAPSGLRLTITSRIDRCAATEVEPGSGLRDLPVPRRLMEAFGHVDCGVYAEIARSGPLSEGHRLLETPQAEPAGLGLR